MSQIFTAAIAAPNLLLTGLLSLVFLYWLFVILGALDIDSFDVDFGGPDVDVDVDVDVDAGAAASADAGQAGISGIYLGILRFFNFGSIPFMMLMSILLLSMWSISILCNHEGSGINPENDISFALMILPLNFLFSLLITKLVTQPLVPFFKNLDTHAKPFELRGRTAVLTMAIEPNRAGQIKLTVEQSVITLKVRTTDGAPLAKGQQVLIVEQVKEEGYYLVQAFEHEASKVEEDQA